MKISRIYPRIKLNLSLVLEKRKILSAFSGEDDCFENSITWLGRLRIAGGLLTKKDCIDLAVNTGAKLSELKPKNTEELEKYLKEILPSWLTPEILDNKAALAFHQKKYKEAGIKNYKFLGKESFSILKKYASAAVLTVEPRQSFMWINNESGLKKIIEDLDLPKKAERETLAAIKIPKYRRDIKKTFKEDFDYIRRISIQTIRHELAHYFSRNNRISWIISDCVDAIKESSFLKKHFKSETLKNIKNNYKDYHIKIENTINNNNNMDKKELKETIDNTIEDELYNHTPKEQRKIKRYFLKKFHKLVDEEVMACSASDEYLAEFYRKIGTMVKELIKES